MAEGDSNFTNVVASGMLSAASVGMGGAVTGGRPVAGLTDSTSTVSGTAQNLEYALNTVTLPANAFSVAPRGLTVFAWGTLAANANSKSLKIYFGGTAVATVASSANGAHYFVVLHVLRTGVSTQSAIAQVFVDTATAPAMAVTTTLAEVETAPIAVTVKSANTAAAAASATGKGMVGFFSN